MLKLAISIRNEVLEDRLAKRGPEVLETSADFGVKARGDKISDEKLNELLQKIEPGALILSEEALEQRPIDDFRSGNCFVIDPIDGTNNFVRRLPGASISVAYMEEGQAVDGVVVSFFSDEHFVGSKGMGAYLVNSALGAFEKLSVEKVDQLSATNIGLEMEMAPNSWQSGCKQPGLLAAFCPPTSLAIRVYEGTAMVGCWVAAGRLGAVVHPSSKAWDIAACALLIGEAGGTVTNIDGSPWDPFTPGIIGTNGALHYQVVGIMRSVA